MENFNRNVVRTFFELNSIALRFNLDEELTIEITFPHDKMTYRLQSTKENGC